MNKLINNTHTPIKKIRGLGSAKDGTNHFLYQRITALASIPLTIFFLFFIILITNKSYEQIIEYINNPVITITLLLFIISNIFHMQLGMQIIIEDYIHSKLYKFILIILNIFFTLTMILICIFSILKINFSG